jgi:hypothetical protein
LRLAEDGRDNQKVLRLSVCANRKGSCLAEDGRTNQKSSRLTKVCALLKMGGTTKKVRASLFAQTKKVYVMLKIDVPTKKVHALLKLDAPNKKVRASLEMYERTNNVPISGKWYAQTKSVHGSWLMFTYFK